MRILLLSAYDAQSHRYWHSLLRAGIPDWDWTTLTLPARHFSWRIRGNPLTWSGESPELLAGDYDLLLATSMVDLATLRGLAPALARIPNVVYFHENQFAYPPGSGRHGLLEAQITSVYTALAADRLVFNSAFNRDSFLAGCGALLARMPDGVPRELPGLLAAKSEVLPVPLAHERPETAAGSGERLQMVWNHRWEFDKGPDALLSIAEGLIRRSLKFTLHVVGQQFRRQPEAFARLKPALEAAGALGRWGFLEDRREYLALLAASDVVLSTAQHDFQGLAVLEACRLGCTPLVPDQLAYPEWIGREFRYTSEEEALDKLEALAARKRQGEALPGQDVSDLDQEVLLPRYRALLQGLVT